MKDPAYLMKEIAALREEVKSLKTLLAAIEKDRDDLRKLLELKE